MDDKEIIKENLSRFYAWFDAERLVELETIGIDIDWGLHDSIRNIVNQEFRVTDKHLEATHRRMREYVNMVDGVTNELIDDIGGLE